MVNVFLFHTHEMIVDVIVLATCKTSSTFVNRNLLHPPTVDLFYFLLSTCTLLCFYLLSQGTDQCIIGRDGRSK